MPKRNKPQAAHGIMPPPQKRGRTSARSSQHSQPSTPSATSSSRASASQSASTYLRLYRDVKPDETEITLPEVKGRRQEFAAKTEAKMQTAFFHHLKWNGGNLRAMDTHAKKLLRGKAPDVLVLTSNPEDPPEHPLKESTIFHRAVVDLKAKEFTDTDRGQVCFYLRDLLQNSPFLNKVSGALFNQKEYEVFSCKRVVHRGVNTFAFSKSPPHCHRGKTLADAVSHVLDAIVSSDRCSLVDTPPLSCLGTELGRGGSAVVFQSVNDESAVIKIGNPEEICRERDIYSLLAEKAPASPHFCSVTQPKGFAELSSCVVLTPKCSPLQGVLDALDPSDGEAVKERRRLHLGCAEAVDVLNQLGILHLDIRMANFGVHERRVRLLDMASAQALPVDDPPVAFRHSWKCETSSNFVLEALEKLPEKDDYEVTLPQVGENLSEVSGFTRFLLKPMLSEFQHQKLRRNTDAPSLILFQWADIGLKVELLPDTCAEVVERFYDNGKEEPSQPKDLKEAIERISLSPES